MITVSVTVEGDKIAVQAPFALKDVCKSLPGARWSPASQRWMYPKTPIVAAQIMLSFQQFDLEAHEDFLPLLAEEAPCSLIFKTKPWKHQFDAFVFAAQKRASMLAMEMGTGKSKVAIDLINSWDCRRVIIACPKSVLNVWRREFKRHSFHPFDVVIDEGRVSSRADSAEFALDVAKAKGRRVAIVINHEAMWREPFGQLVERKEWDAIVIDESHRGKDPKGSFSGFLGGLPRRGERRLMLTGTPMPHSPLDVFSQYRFLDPGIYGTSFHRFKMRYAVLGGFQGKVVQQYQNLDELNEKFYTLAFRVTKAEALDLPEEISVVRECTLSGEERRVYDALETDFYARVADGEITVSNALTQLLRLQQATSGYAKLSDGKEAEIGTSKRDLLGDVIEDAVLPIVVFCRFIHDLDSVHRMARDRGLRSGEISGRRKDISPTGTMPAGIDVLACQIQAGGLGIDLTRASTAIYYSVGFSLTDYVQSQSRLHRPGQRSNVTYIHLKATGTIDEKVYNAIESRRDLIEEALRR